ncbi:hypothetical protein I302_101343 [Kwoniella bestiolae CBS 10118]|uniref:DAGKc domain-containing protein n=1 Tax=Kwoniella bestiolae CBS 10118 TaxID=1296100 RepID=A0A1B9GBZ5_9TREE|nr:hypothetical protein I302_00026 [Kwoniella bestiolae CBS 10118]OCF28539.1 hypothetical protein I302_00026 [Kwoniella bestiolae CBS 10118]
MSTTQDTFHLIVNPVSGHGKGEEFANQTIIPILKHLSIPHEIHTTTSPGDAGNIAKTMLSSQNEKEGAVIVGIVGGDGTFHEFMEGVSSQEVRWEVVLFPYGTANALYSSLFPPSSTLSNQSLINILPSTLSLPEETLYTLSSFFFFLSKFIPVYLPITKTVLSSSSQPGAIEELHSHVVLSTSLHAAILEDSERLRATHPSTERFKIAAQENASKLFYANVTLHSEGEGGMVDQWDAKKGDWVKPYTIPDSTEKSIRVNGPFSYFLSTSTVDRLEPSFVISPLTTLKPTKPNDQPYIYITIIRPSRDPLITSATPSERKEVMSKRAFEVVGNAYSNGNHVNLTFPPREKEGYVLEIKGEGEPVVEVFRCTSFEWQPVITLGGIGGLEGLEKGNARLVCADGALHVIPEGGVARVGLEEKKEDGKGFYVFA